VQSDEQCNIKRALADKKKEKKKRNERKVTSTPPLSFQVLPPSVRLNFMNDITGVMN